MKNLIYSKVAVYAGFTTLLAEAGMDFSVVDRFIITGGFGQYLNIEKAVRIGLLPDIDRSKFTYMGNSSIVGAYLALLSNDYRNEARDICDSITYVDFSSRPQYMDQFTSALFLPHTDLKAFPSASPKSAWKKIDGDTESTERGQFDSRVFSVLSVVEDYWSLYPYQHCYFTGI